MTQLQPWFKVTPLKAVEIPPDALDGLIGVIGREVEVMAEAARAGLFAWHGLPAEGRRTALAYAALAREHGDSLDEDEPSEAHFLACYPFHPNVLAWIRRMWLHGPAAHPPMLMLLLARWVRRAYLDGERGKHREPLISLGGMPFDDEDCRVAYFGCLGSGALRPVIAADIAGPGSHATQLDRQAPDAPRAARLHRKLAATILILSEGLRTHTAATLPAIHNAVAEPDLANEHIDVALTNLLATCFYLTRDEAGYRFATRPNYEHLLAERRLAIAADAVEDRLRAAIRLVFSAGPAWADRLFFPSAPHNLPDRPLLGLVVLDPDHPYGVQNDPAATAAYVARLLREHGAAGRVFRSALLFVAPAQAAPLRAAAATLLVWEGLRAEQTRPLALDESYRQEIAAATARAEEDLQAAIRLAYRWVLLLGPDGRIVAIELAEEQLDTGQPLDDLIRERLLREGALSAEIDPGALLRHWPPRQEWSTRAVRDACYASPALPRPLDATVVRRAIATGVTRGLLGYMVRDDEEGQPVRVSVDTALSSEEVRLGDDTVILRAEDARALLARPAEGGPARPLERTPQAVGDVSPAHPFHWEGAVSWQAYTRLGAHILARFTATPGLSIRVDFTIPAEGMSAETAEEIRAALRDLGLSGSQEGRA